MTVVLQKPKAPVRASDLATFSEGVGAQLDGKISEMIPITYSQLFTARNNSQLIAGQWYRITDYVTEVSGDMVNTLDEGDNQFDVIVLATASNKLSEEARAINHSGASYFANSNLSAWKIWYCLDNDTTRFAWANTTNGKGVIYRMIDEFGNDCPYDFKNITFGRYNGKVVNGTLQLINLQEFFGPDYLDEEEIYVKKALARYNIISESALVDIKPYLIAGQQDPILVGDLQNNYPELYYYLIDKGLTGNDYIMGLSYDDDYGDCMVYMQLDTFNGGEPRIKYFTTFTDFSIDNNGSIYYSEDSSLSGYVYNNKIGNYISNLRFQLGHNIFIGKNVCSNTIGESASYNTCGNSFTDNTIGNFFYSNIIGYNCAKNIIGPVFQENVIGDSFTGNIIGNNFQYNTLGNDATLNNIGNYFYDNAIKNNFSFNVMGHYCSDNCIGGLFSGNTVGNYFRDNTTGYCFRYNTIGNHFYYNTIAKDYVRYLVVEDGNQYITLTSNQTTSFSNNLQNTKIAAGCNNTYTTKTISHNSVNDTDQTIYCHNGYYTQSDLLKAV